MGAAEAENEDEDEDLEPGFTAAEKAINEAHSHAERADALAKEAAELSLKAANESMQSRRMLDQHDIIAIENQTQSDVRKEEVARGLEASSMPEAMLALPTQLH